MHRHSPHALLPFDAPYRLVLTGLVIGLLLYATTAISPSKAQTIPQLADTPTPLPLPTDTSPPPATPVQTAAPIATATPTVEMPATPSPVPQVYISEFMANPNAVADEVGEWLELFNADTKTVNLRGWQLADLGSDRHMIAVDLLIAPGQYLVLARNRDTAVNGGVSASYAYANLTLANNRDELHLLAPDGREADQVEWGEEKLLTITAGASLQRRENAVQSSWTTSSEPWPGSSGDSGSPGSGYQPPASATISATPTLAPGTTATPAPTPVGSRWPLASAPSPLVIDEVLYRGSDAEFVVLYNSGNTALDLTGWAIGDEETPGGGEGFYALPENYRLAPGAQFIIARNGAHFYATWGNRANAEFGETDMETLDLPRLRTLATGQWALNDGGDEVILLNPQGAVVDAVAYGEGDYASITATGTLQAPTSYSLQRVPGPRYGDHVDQRHRFLYAPPDPFHVVQLPQVGAPSAQAVAGNGLALWGSLGASSNFSADGTAPPHYLYDAAAASGLNFLAIADPLIATPWQATTTVLAVPAWQWQQADDSAIIYDQEPQPSLDRAGLIALVTGNQSTLQWVEGADPALTTIAALPADTITAPDNVKTLYRLWRATNAPRLPAGNAAPPEPGRVLPNPRYTGLIVRQNDVGGLQEALRAHRGWLTNRPGLWLTLSTQEAGSVNAWMGSTIAPQNIVTLMIDYGDQAQELAGLTLWQDDRPLQQLDRPVGNQRWEFSIPAIPDTFLYAVATQADGDFAITAPLYVQPIAENSVLINEVLPAPWADYNGDGAANTDDEYIELYNNSPYPRSLTGWQLLDASAAAGNGRAYTFGSGQTIAGHGWLVLYHADSHISLNNEDEMVLLRDAEGNEVDRISWQTNPNGGASLSRITDGGSWQIGNATPGKANTLLIDGRNGQPTTPTQTQPQNDNDDDDGDELPPPVQLPPTYGQAGGPPASVAQSKLAGLEADVEFYAIVTAPPGLFNASIYVADPAPDPTEGPYAGIGINVYLRQAQYPDLQVGDRVRLRGVLKSFRGEMELQLYEPTSIQRVGTHTQLLPLPVTGAEIGESLEGRLVSFRGRVSGWQGDSIYLSDPANPDAEAVRVTVRSSTGWRRPYVKRGEEWQVTGIVSQFAAEAPWNGGYRVLVRYAADLSRLQATENQLNRSAP